VRAFGVCRCVRLLDPSSFVRPGTVVAALASYGSSSRAPQWVDVVAWPRRAAAVEIRLAIGIRLHVAIVALTSSSYAPSGSAVTPPQPLHIAVVRVSGGRCYARALGIRRRALASSAHRRRVWVGALVWSI
jgi:hypothetical protein